MTSSSSSLPLPVWLLDIATTTLTTTTTTTTTTAPPNLTTTTTATTGEIMQNVHSLFHNNNMIHNNTNNNNDNIIIHNLNNISSSASSSFALQTLPEADPFRERVVIALAIVRLVLAVCGFCLNVVAAVVLTSRRLWSPTSMLLLSLVVCDAFYLLLVIPVGAASISANLDFNPHRYSILISIMAVCFPLRNMAQMASTYTTVTVTLERYLVILLPLKASSMWTYGKTRRVIIGIILFSIIFNLPRCFDHLLSQPSGTRDSSEGASMSSLVTPSSLLSPPSSSSSSSAERLHDLRDSSLAGNVSQLAQQAAHSLPERLVAGSDVSGSSENLRMRVEGLKSFSGSYAMSLNGSGLEQLRRMRGEGGEEGEGEGEQEEREGGGEGSSGDGVWAELRFLYQIYLFYPTMIFLYLFPNTLIPILNLQLVLALRRRKEEKRRLSTKKEHRIHGASALHPPADKEEGLTYIVFGITFSYFVCCILPALNMISAIASNNSDNATSIYVLNAAETMLVVNAASDFFFYCLLGRKFRNVFLTIFCPQRYMPNKTRVVTSRATFTYSAV